MIEIICEGCGWLAVTNQPAHLVWAEHVDACPAVGGAVRFMPELPPMPMRLPAINACKHRLVRRQIAVTPSGAKRYAVVCELCGRHLGCHWTIKSNPHHLRHPARIDQSVLLICAFNTARRTAASRHRSPVSPLRRVR